MSTIKGFAFSAAWQCRVADPATRQASQGAGQRRELLRRLLVVLREGNQDARSPVASQNARERHTITTGSLNVVPQADSLTVVARGLTVVARGRGCRREREATASRTWSHALGGIRASGVRWRVRRGEGR